jgi:membrane-associated phospholipid phosphatase
MKKRLFVFFLIGLSLLTAAPARASDPTERIGDVLAYGLLPAAAAGTTLYLRDWKGTFELGESALLNGAVTATLKYTIKEPRPNGKDNLSFPSSHTSFACVWAEFMRKRYGWGYGIPIYMLAAFVGYSRIESKNHHPHDVAAGALIGIGSSFLFTKPYHGIKVSASASAGSYAVQCSGVF